MNAVVETAELPAPVSRRGITEPQWRTLKTSLFPGAKSESIVMMWDYCVARKLDPLKKPCHIVPMQVKDPVSGEYVWRDVVMPGIYEYRTTATRTGLYMGHSKPEYGPPAEFLGTTVPEWCEMTIYRWSAASNQRIEYPVRVYFRECAGTRKDKTTKELVLNQRWATAPIQMMTKVCEAAGLREAFPDELGGEATAEELEGRIIDISATQTGIDPRGDRLEDFELRDKWLNDWVAILNLDIEEDKKAEKFREFDEEISRFPELSIAVLDELAARGIVTKGGYKAWLKIGLPEGRQRA